MMDSSKVLGESKSRLVRLLRDSKASHLLDVDGDVYYHAERCIQAFSAPFRQHPEQLLADLSADFRSSSRSCEFLQDICTALGTEFSLPVPYRSGQWLSTLDGAKRLDALFNPLLVYYFSFLSDSQGVLYQGMMEGVLDTTGCQASDKDMVRQIQSCVKHMFDQCTGEDRERKVRITSRLFVHHDTTLLILSLYTHVLSILHKLLDFFQRPGPILHQFYNYQHQVVQEFLACFVQPECRYLKDVNLQGLDLSDEDTLLPADQLNVGPTARQLIQRLPQHHLVTQTFLHQSLQAYRTCGRLLLRNMPLANQTLKCFRSLGPKMRCSNRRAGETNLGRVLSPVLVPREQYSIEDEVYWFCTDRQVPVTHHGERVDKWWARVFTTTSFYPTLEKCVLTLLSCFHGPLLQPALSITANVVEKGTHTVDIETLSAMHTVQYALQADNAGEASFFATTNLLTNSLGPAMLTNMRSAWKKNEEMEMAKWEERKKRASKRPASDVSPTENKRQPQPPTPE